MSKSAEFKVDFSELKELLIKLPEMIRREKWYLKIIRLDNGYELVGDEGAEFNGFVIEDSETDELKSHEQLLWEVMNYFNFGGSKHDAQRIRIIRQGKKVNETENV